MEEQKYYFKISPENVKRDIVEVTYVENTGYAYSADPCCSITSVTPTTLTGFTGVYSGMSQILSGGTNGQSLLTGLTVPILLTEVATDLGYYSVFDGAILQKQVIHIRFISLILRIRSLKSFCQFQHTLWIGVMVHQYKL
jgi:hypothetical protein